MVLLMPRLIFVGTESEHPVGRFKAEAKASKRLLCVKGRLIVLRLLHGRRPHGGIKKTIISLLFSTYILPLI